MSITPRVGSLPPYGIKAPVVASTTANITLSGEQTIDSVAVTAGDRVLVRSQTDNTENGIYVCSAGAWSRATDANDSNDLINGTMVLDTNSGVVYQFSFSGDYNPGTTAVTLTESSSAFASAAADSATAAQTAETNAETAETNAVAAKNAAETAQTAAETAEANVDGRLPAPGAGDAGKVAVVDSGGGSYAARAQAVSVTGTDTLTASPGWDAYHGNQVITIKAAATNTGAVTLNLDSLGIKSVTLSDGSALPAGSLEASKLYNLWYDGTNFVVLNPSVSQAVAVAGAQSEGNMTPERTQQWYEAGPPSPVTGYIKAGRGYYLRTDGADSSEFVSISGGATDGVATSVGPTGSGASIIWAELDGLPSGVTSISLHLYLSATSAAAGRVGAKLAVSYSSSTDASQLHLTFEAAGASDQGTSSIVADVPVDSNGIFYAKYDELLNVGSLTANLELAGYRLDV